MNGATQTPQTHVHHAGLRDQEPLGGAEFEGNSKLQWGSTWMHDPRLHNLEYLVLVAYGLTLASCLNNALHPSSR